MWCCSSRTSRSWWIAHSTQRQRSGCSNIPPFNNEPTDCTFFLWRFHTARPPHPGRSTILLRLGRPSGMCAKLRAVAASNNRDHAPQSLYYCLFAPHTEYTVHSLSPCYGMHTALVLLKSVITWCNTTKFFTKMASFYMLVCMGVGRNFSRDATSGFFQTFFYGGPKVVKPAFYHSKLRKQHFLLNFTNPSTPSDTPACV